MGTDDTLPSSGKDVTVELMVNGVPQHIIDAVVRFTEEARYDTIESKHIGTTNVDIDKVPIGWQGTIEVSRKNPTLDLMIDAVNQARIQRIPTSIIITCTHRYRDGSFRTSIYNNVRIEFSSSTQRAQANTTTLNWMTGEQRITLAV